MKYLFISKKNLLFFIFLSQFFLTNQMRCMNILKKEFINKIFSKPVICASAALSLTMYSICKIVSTWQECQLHACSCINQPIRDEFNQNLLAQIVIQYPDKNEPLFLVSSCSGRLKQEAELCKELATLGYSNITIHCIDLIYDNMLSCLVWCKKFKRYVEVRPNQQLHMTLFPSMEKFINNLLMSGNKIDIFLLVDPSFPESIAYQEAYNAIHHCHPKTIIGIVDKQAMFEPEYTIHSEGNTAQDFMNNYSHKFTEFS